MGVRGWLGLPDLPPEQPQETDGVIAEMSLRDALLPRLVAATQAMFCLEPPSYPASPEDYARWEGVLVISAAIDREDAECALAGLAALEGISEF